MGKKCLPTACLALLLNASSGAHASEGPALGEDGPPRVDPHGDPLPEGGCRPAGDGLAAEGVEGAGAGGNGGRPGGRRAAPGRRSLRPEVWGVRRGPADCRI